MAAEGMEARAGAADTAGTARTGIMQKSVARVKKEAPQVQKRYRDQLLDRIKNAGISETTFDDERLLKEVVYFADRSDVTEEITRLRSHFEQFSALLKAEGEVGRKSEFLLQEIGREVNTIGSKANDLAIARAVIELKNELERVREQMANVE